jgi:hypothetical protein
MIRQYLHWTHFILCSSKWEKGNRTGIGQRTTHGNNEDRGERNEKKYICNRRKEDLKCSDDGV